MAREGLAAAKAGNYDLIVTDLNMPVMDGLTMIGSCASCRSQAGVPIIFLTTEIRRRPEGARQGRRRHRLADQAVRS